MCAAFNVTVVEGNITKVRIAYGGMAGIPKRANNVETALYGKPWSLGTIDKAVPEFDKDFTPLSDWRASSEYRSVVAKNLLRRFFHENDAADAATRLNYSAAE